jgi:hypothetical protein
VTLAAVPGDVETVAASKIQVVFRSYLVQTSIIIFFFTFLILTIFSALSSKSFKSYVSNI